MSINISRDVELEKLNDKLKSFELSNTTKISLYEQKIAKQKDHVTKRYNNKIDKLKSEIEKNKNKEQVLYTNKMNKYKNELDSLASKNLTKYQIENLKNKIEYKKSKAINEHQNLLAKFQSKYDKNVANLEQKYKDKIEDLDWDLKNYISSLNKSNEDYLKDAQYKIDMKYDKQLYHKFYENESAILDAKLQNTTNKLEKKQIKYEKSHLPMRIVNENNLVYKPWQVKLYNNHQEFKKNIIDTYYDYMSKLRNIRYLTFKDVMLFELFGIPLILFLIMTAVTLTAVYTESLPAETMGSMAILFIIAVIGGEFFNRLPIWKKYIGGGTMGVFFLGAILGTYNLIPHSVVKDVDLWFSKGGFLNLYINILIVGSILTIPRKLILYSFSGLIALIAVGSGLAVLVAIGFGYMMNLPMDKVVLQVILPLLSNGNGGGVQPLSAMSAANHYMDQSKYMSFALAVSGVSNIIVIIFAAILAGSLSKKPNLNGNGNLVKKQVHIKEEKVDPTHRSIAAGLIVCIVIYVLCKFLEVQVKKHTNVTINVFAWAVAFALIINLMNVLPKEIKDGCNVLNKFFSKQFTWFLMAGVGLCMTDLNTFISLFTQWQYMIIILLMDIALIIGPWLLAKYIKFYVLESMIAAGCCMGAQGGAGSLAVIGAAKRMELMPYSQITCRVGGGIVLIVAAPLFIMFTR